MGVGLAIAFLFVGFIVGFLVGARTRQLQAKMQMVGKAVFSIHLLLKIKEAMVGMDDAEAVNDGEDDNDPDDTSSTKNAEDILDEFLNTDAGDGIDDHPDVEISPVFMFQIKKSKDQQRLEKQKALLMAEGLTEAEADERIASGAELGAGAGDVRANPLAVLIAAGARVEAARGATSDEMLKKVELRRKQRNINVYISKQFDIDTKVARKDEGAEGGAKSKGGKKSALEVARETKVKPFGGDAYSRELRAVKSAKSSRALLKEWKTKDDAMKKASKKNGIEPTNAGLIAATEGLEYGTGDRRAGGVLGEIDLAALLDEEGGEEGGEEGFDDDDGEEYAGEEEAS